MNKELKQIIYEASCLNQSIWTYKEKHRGKIPERLDRAMENLANECHLVRLIAESDDRGSK